MTQFKNKLRVAMLASNVVRIPPIPPEKYVPPGWSGAPELIVHHITEELVRRGHEVTLFASGDSSTHAKLVSVTPTATWQIKPIGRPTREYERMLVAKAYEMAAHGHFDIIHSHHTTRSIHFAPLVDTPTIATLHNPLDIQPIHLDLLSYYKKTQYYASISQSQRRLIPGLQYAVTAYNGVEVDQIPFSDKKDDYFIFAGRVQPEKGVSEAIQVAQKVGTRLLIFGSIDGKGEYWQKEIQSKIDGKQIVYMGLRPRKELFKFMAHAKAFIFPLQWEEPFGLVVIEALACGTPTLTFRRGSMPELIEHGKTGFLVSTIDEMVEAARQVDKIDPYACRQRAEQEFSVAKMVDRYEEAYYRILNVA